MNFEPWGNTKCSCKCTTSPVFNVYLLLFYASHLQNLWCKYLGLALIDIVVNINVCTSSIAVHQRLLPWCLNYIKKGDCSKLMAEDNLFLSASLLNLACIDFGQQLTSVIGSGETLMGFNTTWWQLWSCFGKSKKCSACENAPKTGIMRGA